MSRFKFAALAAGLLLQSLAYPGNAPTESVSGNLGSGSLDSARHTVGRVEERWNNSLALDDDLRAVCDPEDDCPLPPPPTKK